MYIYICTCKHIYIYLVYNISGVYIIFIITMYICTYIHNRHRLVILVVFVIVIVVIIVNVAIVIMVFVAVVFFLVSSSSRHRRHCHRGHQPGPAPQGRRQGQRRRMGRRMGRAGMGRVERPVVGRLGRRVGLGPLSARAWSWGR